MEQNPESALAWQFIESTGTHLFLTGKAGTGKTTFLRKLKQESPKRMVVVAPTGIAAINAGGVTIHSFFQIPFAPYVPESSFSTNGKASYRFRFGKEKINIIRSMDLLVIDEISTQANIDDCVDPGVGFKITFEDLLVFDASTVRGDNDCKTHSGIPSSIIQKLRCSWSPKGDGSIVASVAHPLTSVHVRVFPLFCCIFCLSEHAHFCAQGHKSTQNTPTMW